MRFQGGCAQGLKRRGSALVLAPVLALGALAACADREPSLCEVYDDWLGVKAEIEALDPQATDAEDAAEEVEEALDVTRRLRTTDPERYGDALEALEVALEDVLRTLESVPDDADFETWAPLVEDSVEDAVDAADRVEELIDPTCRPGD